jgi:hypothetical protein
MLTGVVVGVLVGIVYTLSPLTVWFMVAAVLIVAAAGRGLDADERRRIQTVLVVSILVRVAAVLVLFLTTNHAQTPFGFFFGDEEYFIRRSMWLRNVALGIPIHRADLIYAFDDYSETSQLYVFAFIQALVGFSPYGLHLVGIALYLAAVVILTRTIRPSFGATPSLLALVLMLTLPSLFAWSISALKEPLFFLLTAIALAAAVGAARPGRWRSRLAWAAVTIGATVALETVRRGGLALEGASIGTGLLLAWLLVRPRMLVATVLAAVTICAIVVARPEAQVRAASALAEIARVHRGHVWTPGHNYHVLDDRLYGELVNIRTIRFDESARFVVRAFASYVMVPLPNQIYSTAALAFLPEQLAWLCLLAIAPVGFFFSLRRNVVLASVLAMHAVIAALPVALTSGNIGTLVRHRGFALPFLICLGAVGICELLARAVGPMATPQRSLCP